MKIIILLFSLFTFSFSISLFADDKFVEVAVGVAKKGKDKILIESFECSGPGVSLTQHREVVEIVRNDLSFYQHIFEVFSRNKAEKEINDSLNWAKRINDIIKEGFHFVVHLSCLPRETRVVVFQVNLNKTSMDSKVYRPVAVTRKDGHELSDLIFQSITKKSSVFKSQIIFASTKDATAKKMIKEIYMMDFDGFNLKKLTDHKGIAISPAFSPDNKKIIYSLIDSKKRIKNVALHELDLSTMTSRNILDNTGMNSGAVYSPDGKGVFLTQSYKGNADIFYYDLNTKASRQVTNNSAEDVDPSYRADGKVMTFLSNRAGRANIYTLDPSALEQNVKRISFVGQFNATPRFSPDGSEIVFSSWVDNMFDIYRIGVDGNNLVRLTKNYGSNEDPTFSNDGEFIVFTSRKVFSRSKAEQRIYIMTKDGEILGPLSNTLENCYSPRFSN
ncbi:MAG: hypothetical protein QE271_13185 [Bacteriovoracaceae bacterium]|nr:hypothetical protein [Bacteriovoracaceae bacterium]